MFSNGASISHSASKRRILRLEDVELSEDIGQSTEIDPSEVDNIDNMDDEIHDKNNKKSIYDVNNVTTDLPMKAN